MLNDRVKRVVVMVQENHTTDNYFRGLAAYGANVATGWPDVVGIRQADLTTAGQEVASGRRPRVNLDLADNKYA